MNAADRRLSWMSVPLVVLLLLAIIVLPVGAAAADRKVVIFTAPPYSDVSLLAEELRSTGASVRVHRLTGCFSAGVSEVQGVVTRSGSDRLDVVAVGGSALPLRWALEQDHVVRERVEHLVLLASPNRGAIGAEAIYSQRLTAEVEQYRLERAMYRREEMPAWKRPEYYCLVSYLADRSRELFEPLYHNYLVSDRMSLAPAQVETASGYMSWLTQNYSGRLEPYLTDASTPVQWRGTLQELEGSDPGRILSWGYVDLVAADLTRFTYFSTLPAGRALSEDVLEDVTITGDWRSMAVEFLTRRALRFVQDYIAPQAYRTGRWAGVQWFQRQTDLADAVLLYQLPEQISIPCRGDRLWVPVNDLLQRMNAAGSPSPDGVVILEAPNWWQLVDAGVGPNDWWTETVAAAAPGGASVSEEVFVPTGGRPANDEEAVAAVLRLLEMPGGAAGGGHPVWHWAARGADVLMGLWTRVRGSGAPPDSYDQEVQRQEEDGGILSRHADPGDLAGEDDGGDVDEGAVIAAGETEQEEIPSISATYRNKSTTLKSDRRLPHDAWLWDFGDGDSVLVEDPNNVSGSMEHRFSGPGEYEVTAHSTAADGTVLREIEWDVQVEEANKLEEFSYATAAEIVPLIDLHGPRKWVVGRYAEYSVDARLDDLPEEVENLQIVIYPGEKFRVTWERPGTFQVKAAVNLRYSWRFADGTSRYFSVIYTDSHPVEVLATGLGR